MKKINYFDNEKTLSVTIYIEILFLIVLVSLSAYLLRMQYISHRHCEQANELRYNSFLLADQLRHSSDDLTRMVRSYVSTGDSIFEDYFWDIFNIRNGNKERPNHYERIYWDFLTVENPKIPYKDGPKVPLETLMKDAGVTDEEFKLLAEAKKRSDDLISLEKIAMHAMKGEFRDLKGDFTIHRKPDPEMARSIVFGKEYHEAKLHIMEPINEFYKTIDQRTMLSVSRTNSRVMFYQESMVFIFILLIINGILLLLTSKRHQYVELRARKESEEQLKEAQKIAKLGHWELNLQTNKLIWSDEIYRIFEIDPFEFGASYEAFIETIHPDDRDLVNKEYMDSVSNKAPYAIDHRLLFKDGRIKVVHEQGKTFYDDQGNATHSIGIVQDITLQKQMENELKTTQMHYTDFINASSDPVSYLKVPPDFNTNLPVEKQIDMLYHSTFIDSNKANWKSFGLKYKAELIGKTYIDLLHEKTFDKVFTDFIANNYKLINYEICQKSSQGDIYYGLENWFGVIENGTLTYIWTISKNITDRKKAEQEKSKLESQLRQAQKMEVIGQLAGGVAHDFNNILTIINGYSGLLLKQDLSEALQNPIKEIQAAGIRASRLTSQLLAFSRKQIILPEILNLNDLVKNQMKMLSRFVGEDVEISTIFDDKLRPVNADPGQIEQIIMNITINARDAMPKGGKITIETKNMNFDNDYIKDHPDAKAGKYSMFSISDTGVGMDENTRTRIFEPFYTTKGHDKGTGLGLSTVYGIVKQSDGFIYVYSEINKGSTFKIYLPSEERRVKQRKTKPVDDEKLKGQETILLVEDDASVRVVTEAALQNYGYNIISASNGEEALRVYDDNKGKFDLLITDVVMPLMSGRELVEKLHEKHNDLRVLYFSGYTDDSIVRHGIISEGMEFIQKPYSHRELALKVKSVLGK